MEVFMERQKFFSAKTITGIAVLTALVVLLQMVLGSIRIGITSFSLVLIPIALGGMLYGPLAGGFLGLVFGFITLMYGVTGADPFTAILLNDHPIITSLLCLGKGTFAGLFSGLAFMLLKRVNEYVGVFVSAAITPIVNTGLFILGALTMSDTLSANFVADGTTVIYFLVIGCAGINFLVEFAVNLLSAPAVYRVIGIIKRRK